MGSNGRRGSLALLGCVGALVCALSVTGCSSSSDDGNGDTKGQASVTDAGGSVSTLPTGADAGALLSDGQVYELLQLTNSGEEAVAEMAEQRAVHPAILSVALQIDDAQALIEQRIDSYASMSQLAEVDSPQSTTLSAATMAEKTQLASLTGPAFDSAYVSAEVSAQQSALSLIDTVLLPESGAPNLQILVQETRNLVATHLAELQALEGDAGATS